MKVGSALLHLPRLSSDPPRWVHSRVLASPGPTLRAQTAGRASRICSCIQHRLVSPDRQLQGVCNGSGFTMQSPTGSVTEEKPRSPAASPGLLSEESQGNKQGLLVHRAMNCPSFLKAEGGAAPLLSGAKLTTRPRGGHRRPEEIPGW